MKHAGKKILLTTALACLTAGGICLGAGLAMGGSPSFYVDAAGIHVKENTPVVEDSDYILEKTRIQPVKKLDISLENADFYLVTGKEWAVEYVLDGSVRTAPEYHMENGVLKLYESDRYREKDSVNFSLGDVWWEQSENQKEQKPYVRLTVPAAAGFDEVRLSVGCGDVSIDRLDSNLSVLELAYGELEACLDQTGAVEIDTEDADVELQVIGSMEDYGVDLYTEYGEIQTPYGTAEGTFSRRNNGKAGILVNTEYGEIRIREKAE